MRILGIIGFSVGALLVVLGGPGLAAGYGLLHRKPWARMLALVLGILNLVNIPIGTVMGVYTLWVLLDDRAYLRTSVVSDPRRLIGTTCNRAWHHYNCNL